MYLQYIDRKDLIHDSVYDRNLVISDNRPYINNGNAITAVSSSKQIYIDGTHNNIFNKARYSSENEMMDCITDIPDSLVSLRNQYLARTGINNGNLS